MLNRILLKSIVSSGTAAIFVASLGTHAFGGGEESRDCRDLRTDIAAIRLALGVVDGKVDQSNQSSAAIRLDLGVVGGKVDRSNQSSAAIMAALGVVDGKVGQSNADLAIVRRELQAIRQTLLTQSQGNSGLQLVVEADEKSCASGAIQCAFAILPSSLNQIPVELKLLVMRDQASVTNLGVSAFSMTVAFWPDGGPDVTACASRETGCGSPEFFINKGNGGYQMWVHPTTENWMSGTYSLLLRVTDTEGHVATKLVNVSIDTGTRDPREDGGLGVEKNQSLLDAVN